MTLQLDAKFVTYNNDGECTVGDDQSESEERFHENYSGPCRTVAIVLTVPEVPDPTEVAITVPEELAGPAKGEPIDNSEDDEDDADKDPTKGIGGGV